jgi:hypothetical protein
MSGPVGHLNAAQRKAVLYSDDVESGSVGRVHSANWACL